VTLSVLDIRKFVIDSAQTPRNISERHDNHTTGNPVSLPLCCERCLGDACRRMRRVFFSLETQVQEPAIGRFVNNKISVRKKRKLTENTTDPGVSWS
jgi:hypothetical protein